jgi:hypothetical protein
VKTRRLAGWKMFPCLYYIGGVKGMSLSGGMGNLRGTCEGRKLRFGWDEQVSELRAKIAG